MTDNLFNQELEEAVVGAALVDSASLPDIQALLNLDDLFLLRGRLILKAAISIFERNETVDLLSVEDELKGSLDDPNLTVYLAQLITHAAAPRQVEPYCRRIAGYAYRRRLLQAGDEIKRIAMRDEALDLRRAAVEAELEKVDGALRDDRQPISLYGSMSGYLDYLEASADMQPGVTGLATGLNDLDELLDGLQLDSLNVWAGVPGAGKTAAMLCAALHVARQQRPDGSHRRVYIWTGEMPEAQIRDRFLSIEAEVTSEKIRRGARPGGQTQTEMERVGAAAGRLANLSIFIDDAKPMTVRQLYARIRRMARLVGGFDLIVIDYLGLLESGKPFANTAKEEGYKTKFLKRRVAALAPVLLGCQLNRSVSGVPTLRTLRDSGEIEEDADTVAFIHRPIVFDDNYEQPGEAWFIVAKNRHGDTGKTLAYFRRGYTKFTNAQVQHINIEALTRNGSYPHVR
jgi:replicative DNA helicase